MVPVFTMLRWGLICWSVALVSAARYCTLSVETVAGSVVTVTALLGGETLPAASKAVTV